MQQNKNRPLESLPRVTPGAGFGMLDGVVVVDLTTSVAGPYATMLLADMGATVIKVERPGGGDDARSWGPPFLDGESLWFLSVNRNKKSVVIDTTQAAGKEVLARLVASSDIVVTNQPPRVQVKLGLDFDSMRAIKDDLIFVSITGFGLDGERTDLTCYDLIAEGYSGVMDLTGALGGEPQKVGTPAADMLAGQDAAMAAMAALFDRMRSGRGRLIDISLVESMTRFLSCRIVPYLGSGEAPTRSGGTDSVIAIYQAFDTADDPITLGLGNDGIWQRFWQAVGEPQYAKDPELASNAKRREQRARIVDDIQVILLRESRAHWLKVFAEARVPAGPINGVDETAADEALRARGLFFSLDTGTSLIPQVGLGIHVDGESSCPRSAPPKLGEHTEQVLQELLDYSPQDCAALRAAGVA